MRNALALLMIRVASSLVAGAAKLAIRALPAEPTTLLDDMDDSHWLAMADGEILSRALRGIGGER